MCFFTRMQENVLMPRNVIRKYQNYKHVMLLCFQTKGYVIVGDFTRTDVRAGFRDLVIQTDTAQEPQNIHFQGHEQTRSALNKVT